MRSTTVLGILAAVLPISVIAKPNIQTQFITTNFTFPSADNATVDFSGPITITWDLPTDPKAREFSYETLKIGLTYRYTDTDNIGRPVVEDLNPRQNNYTWEDPEELFRLFHDGFKENFTTVGDMPTGKRWWFDLKFRSENRSEVGVVTSSAFAIEGIEGYDGPGGSFDANGAGVVRPAMSAAALGLAAVGFWLL